MALAMEITATFFRLRAAGKRIGAVTPSGGGILGMLRSLTLEGPQTVPQIARSRPVARQHIQRLANEAEAEGLIEFVDNPAHRRSKLMRITPKGETTYGELMGRMAAYTGQEIAWEQALQSQQNLMPQDLDWDTQLDQPPRATPGLTKFV